MKIQFTHKPYQIEVVVDCFGGQPKAFQLRKSYDEERKSFKIFSPHTEATTI